MDIIGRRDVSCSRGADAGSSKAAARCSASTRAGAVPGRGPAGTALIVGSLMATLFASSGKLPAQAAGGAIATPASAPTPTPTPTPNPVSCTVPPGDDLTIHWYPGANDAAYGCGSTDAARTNLGKPAVSYRAPNQSLTVSDASIGADLSVGFPVTFSADRPAGSTFQGFGKNDGARLRRRDTVEDRLAIVVRPEPGAWALDQRFVIYVNALGACSVQAPRLDVDGRRGCKTIVNVKKNNDALKAAGIANCAEDSQRFCGRVTVPWTTFSTLVSPGTIVGDVVKETRGLEICTGFTDHDVETDADLKALTCKNLKVANESGVADPGQRRVSYHSAAGSSGASPAPSASPAAPAKTSSFIVPRLAVRDVATGSPTPKPSGAQTGSGLLYDATGVLPLGNTARLSAALGRVDVSSLLARLQQNYAAASKGLTGNETGSLIPDKGDLGCPKGCADDAFASLDTAFFEVVHTPFRRGVESQFARDQVDLKPVDFTKIPTLNYGAKLVASPPHARVGLAWFRDIDDVESGTALHAERDFGPAILGLSHVVANIDPAHDANVYRLDERRNASGDPLRDIGHTTNTVLGAVLPLTPDRSFQIYGRHGIVRRSGAPSSAHETLGVFSYSPTDGGPVMDAVGSQQRFFGAAGFRTIDLAYDPLATAYDPFVGTKSSFATVGYSHYDGAQNSDEPNIKLSVTGVRAWAGGVTRYNSVAITALAKLNFSHHPFTLSATHGRSNIAQSVFARIGATVKIPDAQGDVLVRNDSDSVSLGFQALGFDFSAGPSWSNVPNACSATGAPACPAKYARTVAYSVKRDDAWIFLDAALSLVPSQQAKFDQKTVPVDQLETKGVLAYQGWCTPGPRYQPALTYDSNISQDGSAYLPGHLIEARLDFGSPNARHVFRVSYKLVLDQSGSPVSQSQHGLFFGVATDSQSERFRNHCPDVLKNRSAKKKDVQQVTKTETAPAKS